MTRSQPSRSQLSEAAQAPAARFPHWPQFPVRVFVIASDAVQTQEVQTALAGLHEWVEASHGKVCYTLVASSSDADITVRFEPERYLSADVKSIGETTTVYSGLTLKRASIRLAEGNMAPEDLQSAAAHEFGHALGIQSHSDDPDDLMFPTESVRFSAGGDFLPVSAHPVTDHDLRMLKACYPSLFAGVK